MKKIFIFVLVLNHSMHALFEYDRAISHVQKGNAQKSKELLTHALINSPDRADILYDMGTHSYKNGAYDTALAYFNKAAKASNEQILQEQSYFNAGNAHVALKQLQEAIDSYDKVLALNPKHERALHNKEIVKKMLEQQKQEEKKNQDKDQEQKDKEQKDKDKDKDKKENQDSHNNKDDKQNESQNNQDQQQDKQENKQDQNKKNEQESKQEQEKSDKQDKNQQEQKQQAEKKEKEDGAHDGEQKKQQAEEQRAQQSPQQDLSPRMARILNEREKKDAQLNKKMIKAMAGTHAGGKDDYNCW